MHAKRRDDASGDDKPDRSRKKHREDHSRERREYSSDDSTRKVSRHSSSKSTKHKRHRKSKRDVSSDESRTSSGYDSPTSSESPSEDERRARKKEKARKKRKEEKRQRRKEKKRKEKKGNLNDRFGKYGVIFETDIYKKDAELNAWLLEVKKVSPDEVSLAGMKQYFKEFMEDYNTASLPHKKYYDMAKWEKKMQSKKDHDVDPDFDGTMDLFRDQEAVRRQRGSGQTSTGIDSATLLSRDDILELKRIEAERVVASKLRRMGYQPKTSMGVRYEREGE